MKIDTLRYELHVQWAVDGDLCSMWEPLLNVSVAPHYKI